MPLLKNNISWLVDENDFSLEAYRIWYSIKRFKLSKKFLNRPHFG